MSFDALPREPHSGVFMPNDELLRLVSTRLHLIGANCFDMKAREQLRSLAEEIDRRMAVPPVILTKPDSDPEITGR